MRIFIRICYVALAMYIAYLVNADVYPFIEGRVEGFVHHVLGPVLFFVWAIIIGFAFFHIEMFICRVFDLEDDY